MNEIPTDILVLEKEAKQIVKRRFIIALVMMLPFAVIACAVYVHNLSLGASVSSLVWIMAGIAAILSIVMIIEAVNLRRIHGWYYYVNYFVWNIAGQVRELMARRRLEGARRETVLSLLTLRFGGAVKNHYEQHRAEEAIYDSQKSIRSTYIVDRYIDTRDAADVSSQLN